MDASEFAGISGGKSSDGFCRSYGAGYGDGFGSGWGDGEGCGSEKASAPVPAVSQYDGR